jgi:broad specificity phosphatase PhoE
LAERNLDRPAWRSAGNVARDAADLACHARIDIAERDVDVPLSPLDQHQSEALGAWLSKLPQAEQPDVIVASPYKRAVQTADTIARQLSLRSGPSVSTDERLREKEFGILDRLTRRGIEELHQDRAEFRRILGKFYHRPPAGESWCDVILRLRSMLDTISLHYADHRVLIVAHQVVVSGPVASAACRSKAVVSDWQLRALAMCLREFRGTSCAWN